MSLTSGTRITSKGSPGIIASLNRYISLLKIRPMSAVIYSAVVGLIAAGSSIDLLTACIAIACIAAGGGGSAALNMWYEADLDQKMARTARRALPAGKLKAIKALIFGTVLCLGSIIVMGLAVNWLAAAVLAATIFAYFGLYTVALKRRTSLNVVIGGSLAGVLTPLCGWTAATGQINATAIWLFLYVLFWTPPHVWSQAIYRITDYQNAGVPMLPATHGIQSTQRWIMVFTLIHIPLALLPWFTGDVGMIYLLAAIVAGAGLAWRLAVFANCRGRSDIIPQAHIFFRTSILYIVIVLTALAIDRTLMLG